MSPLKIYTYIDGSTDGSTEKINKIKVKYTV